ncbi:MAG: Ig-like domain-containing protein [Propionibacteriaceae bacterium]|nr:Ig-like domain-containing protein [Propionibacteriaceae bacterium]
MVAVRTRRWLGPVVLLAVVAMVATLAVTHRGVPAAEVSLNDGGVWVTNEQLHLAAHLNYPSRSLDGGVRTASTEFDVTQRGNDVLLHDRASGSLAPIDPANLTLGDVASVGGEFEVMQGGDTTAVLHARTGQLWVSSADAISGFSPDTAPILEDPEGLLAAVGVDGVVHALAKDGTLHRITTVKGTPKAARKGSISGLTDFADVQLSVVGDTPVVLDPAGSSVRTAQGSTTLPNATGAVIQQPGADAADVIVASPTALVWAPVGGGAPVEAPARPVGTDPGVPVAPVFLNGCAYGAWSGSGAYLRDCVDDTADQRTILDATKSASKLRFRVNRDVIVLNDVATGLLVLVNDQHRTIDNWQTVQSQVDSQDSQSSDQQESTAEDLPEQAPREQLPPIANPDEFGVRAGRATTLPVLANDSSPAGHALTATALGSPRIGPVTQVRGGQSLRIATPHDAQGDDEFSYRVDDGKGQSAETTVRVSVHPPTRNDAPAQRTPTMVAVGQGDEVSVAVLTQWLDPNGDDIFLTGATAPDGLSVRHRPDGVVTIRDLGTGAPGVREVALTVSDGTATAQGTLSVHVQPRGDLPPVANADHAVTWQGQEITIEPLLNDTDPNGTRPRLARVAEAGPGQQIQTDLAAGMVRFRADEPGTYQVEYAITDGPHEATSSIRVDVFAPAPDATPIADDDIALVSADGVAVVDVLANDTDPGGGVLVIQRVNVPADAPISVEIVDQSKLRVRAPAELAGETRFTYTVSNGSGAADGQVTVVPLPATANDLPPITVEDTATVRAGDIVTIPVLANDSSPTGLPLELRPEIQHVSGDESGTGFVSGRMVRYRAGQVPGVVRLAYTVTDSADNPASAEVAITVTAGDAANTPPRPQPVVARVLAGNTVRIPIPTDRVDPDGDSVSLTGLGRVPAKGTAELGATWIDFTAAPDATGSDSLSYIVTDRFGQSTEGDVRVGIAPPAATNQAPVAMPDQVYARPGRQVLVPVLGNDVDPDGDELTLVPDSVTPIDSATPSGSAVIESDAVVVTTSSREGVQSYFYDVTDSRGGTARGIITVTVGADAPLRAPIAHDDVIAPADIVGKTSIEIDVLANDVDPDGYVRHGKLDVTEGGARVTGDKITVPVTDQRAVILYAITDGDGLTGRAAIIVPPGNRLAPALKADKAPARVKAGETLQIPLRDWVDVRAGRSPKLTTPDRVRTGPGSDGSQLVVNDTTLQFTAQPTFSGNTALSFEVTDGTTPADPEGLSAMLTLPIEVTPADEKAGTPPQFRPTEVTVAPLEDPQQLNLTAMVTDPDPGDMERLRFTLGPVTGGFAVQLNGSTLTVSAPDGMPPGTTGTAEVTVTDGSTEPVAGQVQIRSIASTRPRIIIRDAVIPDARPGQPSQVNIADYVTNPFAAENRPVTMVGAPVVTAGQGTATAAGLVVTTTPAANSNGQVVVAYQLADATGDPNRHVQGHIRLTVQDRPAAPTAVRAASQAAGSATVSWTAGPANGSPITGFIVRHPGGQQDCGIATTCTISGLANGRDYAFTVVAVNAVGESDPSAPSNVIRPDVRPNPPAAPQATATNGEATVTWAAATTQGSPVTGYTVEISPPTGAAQRQVTGNSVTWPGLTNGTAYTFRVRAHSAAEEPSEWSPWSAPATPVGPPAAPTAPGARVTHDAGPGRVYVNIGWTATNGNGDTALTYHVRNNRGEIIYTGPGGPSSGPGQTGSQPNIVTVLPTSTEAHTFQVMASNRAGDSPWSPPSAPFRIAGAPGPVTGLTATATGVNNQVRLTFNPADGNGATPGEITYQWRANGQGGTVPSGGGLVTSAGGFPNGQNVTVEVYARSSPDNVMNGRAISTTVTPYGPPVSPTIRCMGEPQTILCDWSGGLANGRATNYRLSGDGTGTVDASGRYAFSIGPDPARRTLCIQAFQEGGATGDRNCSTMSNGGVRVMPTQRPQPTTTSTQPRPTTTLPQATTTQPRPTTTQPGPTTTQPQPTTTQPRPPASYSWARGGAAAGCPASWGACNYVLLTLRNYNPNSQVRCTVPGVGGAGGWSGTVTVNGDGNWSGNAPGTLRVGNYSVDPNFGSCQQQ